MLYAFNSKYTGLTTDAAVNDDGNERIANKMSIPHLLASKAFKAFMGEGLDNKTTQVKEESLTRNGTTVYYLIEVLKLLFAFQYTGLNIKLVEFSLFSIIEACRQAQTCQKEINKIASLFASAQKEKSIKEYYAKKLKGDVEVSTEFGKIDIVTDSHVYEVKAYKDWKKALGQVLVYSSCEKKLPALILFDCPDCVDGLVSKCAEFGVEVILSTPQNLSKPLAGEGSGVQKTNQN